jgi:class I fructose-bisphosphate aldolase
MSYIAVDKLLRNKRAMILSYDFGIEHGPSTMNDKNIDPTFALDIALEGRYSGIILTPGLAEKYYNSVFVDVPLIIKINSKTAIPQAFPLSKTTCSVQHAIRLGASAIGYTIYDGSPAAPDQFHEFGQIVEQAHDYGIPVIAYMYPRGPGIKDELNDELLAYSARVALELGADFVKLKYNNHMQTFSWIVRCAGRSRVLVTADYKAENDYLLRKTHDILTTGASGIVVGPHIWKHERPFSLSKALGAVIYDHKSPETALQYLH